MAEGAHSLRAMSSLPQVEDLLSPQVTDALRSKLAKPPPSGPSSAKSDSGQRRARDGGGGGGGGAGRRASGSRRPRERADSFESMP